MLARVFGIAVVEPLRRRLVGVVGVAVELQAVGVQVAEVAEQLQVVLARRVAPGLRGVGHGGVAGRDHRRCVGALHAAVGRTGIAVLQAQVGEAVVAERQPHVAGDVVRVAVARAIGAGVELQAAALAGVLEQEVQHAGDGVRAVLRRGAVAQHLHLPQGDRRDGRDVGSLRAVRHTAEPDEDRRAVAALAVDQHQRVVVGEVAQAGRPHERRRAADRVRGDVERGNQVPQLVVERGGSLAHDVAKWNGVDGNRRCGHRARLRAAADDDHLLFELHRQGGVDGYGNPGVERHAASDVRLEAGQCERHVVRARRESGDRERAHAVGNGRFNRTAGLGAARLHNHAGQHEIRRVGDGACDDRLLSMDKCRRRKSHQQREKSRSRHSSRLREVRWRLRADPISRPCAGPPASLSAGVARTPGRTNPRRRCRP